ncbi:MAG: MBG domain-containing protein, partial [Luteolibacter sp.]
SSGPTTGGTTVTITGTGLSGATAVTIGGVPAVIGSVAATSITVTTPGGTVGQASVLVTTPGGTNAANTLYTYIASTTTTLTSSQNPNVFQTQPTFTARAISGQSGLTGQMELLIDGLSLEKKAVDVNGYATFTPPATALRGGSRTINAVFNGDQAVLAFASSSATLTQIVNKFPLAVTLSNLYQVYNGTAKTATATVVPPATHTSVQVDITYAGSSTPPVNAGTYAVVATINDPSLQGTATDTLTIAAAPVAVLFSSMVVGYDGQSHAAVVATNPVVPVTLTYQLNNNGLSGSPFSTPPTNAGNYNVVATSPNYALNPLAGNLTITKGAVSIKLDALSVVADGAPKPVTVTTTPPGIAVGVTYTVDFTTLTSAPSLPPEGGGTWRVRATVTDPNYSGAAAADLKITATKRIPVVTFKGPASDTYRDTVTYTANVPPIRAGVQPSGVINFKSNNVVLSTKSPGVDGTCTWSPYFQASGTPYSITAEYSGDADYFPAASSPVLTTVNKYPLTYDSGTVVRTYNGFPQKVVVVIDPAQFPLTVSSIEMTYNGSPTPPTNATTTPVTLEAIINVTNSNYDVRIDGQLTIGKARGFLQLGNLYQNYKEGASYEASIETTPRNLPVVLSYNRGPTPPNYFGNHLVMVHCTDPNYQVDDVSGTLQVVSSPVIYDIANRFQNYDGKTKEATITTTPAIPYYAYYNNAAEYWRPTAPGAYPIEIVPRNPSLYTGKAYSNLYINAKVDTASTDGKSSGVGKIEVYGADRSDIYNNFPSYFTSFPVYVPPGEWKLAFTPKATTATERWSFQNWEDGSKENPRFIKIGESMAPTSFSYKAIAGHEEYLKAEAFPNTAGVALGEGWCKEGDVWRFEAVPYAGQVLDYWSYNGKQVKRESVVFAGLRIDYGNQILDGGRTLLLRAVRGGGAPTVHFTPGYTAEAFSSENGRASLTRSDRVGIDDPSTTRGVPNGVKFMPPPFPKWDTCLITGPCRV